MATASSVRSCSVGGMGSIGSAVSPHQSWIDWTYDARIGRVKIVRMKLWCGRGEVKSQSLPSGADL